MYYKEDFYLKKEFEKICQITNEQDKLTTINRFFCLYLPDCYPENYEIISLTDNPFISVAVKDKIKNSTYYASYEKDSRLLKRKSDNFDFVNVRISLPDRTEREKTYYRFGDFFDSDPLHDEVSTVFPGNYKLTLTKKYPSFYPFIEQGIYITLYDTKNSIILYHNKIHILLSEIKGTDLAFTPEKAFVKDYIPGNFELCGKIHYGTSFESIFYCYLNNKNRILDAILEKINA